MFSFSKRSCAETEIMHLSNPSASYEAGINFPSVKVSKLMISSILIN